MALELQTELPTPNVPLFPQIILQTSVKPDGKLQVTAMISAAYAHVDNYGLDGEQWQQIAPGGHAVVSDLLALPDDLAHLKPAVEAAWPVIVGLCQGINTVRKLV